MIKLIRNANDTASGCMIDLVTISWRGCVNMWGSFHVDMLAPINVGPSTVDGIKNAYEELHQVGSVECVLLTIEEFKALTGKVPA